MAQSSPIPPSTLDHVLTTQLAVAWAGEAGEEPRLGWWRTDLVSEFGGEDLFRRMLPASWQWAVLQGAREAARRHDAAGRSKDHDPDRILSLFRLGFEVDERLDERLQDLKRTDKAPTDALPGLRDVITEDWRSNAFTAWVDAHGTTDAISSPTGRRIKGNPPASLELLADHLVGALAPLGSDYPLPHYRMQA